MAEVTIILTDTAAGGVSIHSSFQPSVGAPCSNAQAAALDIIARTKLDWGLKTRGVGSAAVEAAAEALKKLAPMSERGR